MIRPIKSALCLTLAALTLLAAGCSGEKKEQSAASKSSSGQTVAPTTVAPTTQPLEATADSALQNEGDVSYNELEIKKSLSEIETTLDKLIETHGFMGAVYAKVGNDFEYIKAKGFANQGEHIDNSIYRSSYGGSLTKLFTATAVMKLAEEKKLSLDDTLDKYFSGCAYGKEVTVRQLLGMTSGIPNYLTRGEAPDNEIMPVDALRDKLNDGSSYEKNKATILSWILSQPRREAQEDAFEFSDSNYYLLGEIIGSAAQVPYETYLSEEIFKPAMMNKTGFESDDATARPYDSGKNTAPLLYEAVGYSAVGVITNVSDLLKFVDAFTGGQLVGEDSLREMLTDHGSGYGYGAYVNGSRVSCIGEVDSYSAKLSFSTDESQMFAALSNYADCDPNVIHGEFRNYLRKFRN